jgi:nucleoside-diphosphate kinase
MTGETENVTMEVPHVYVERTLAIIKPDAAHKSEEIEDIHCYCSTIEPGHYAKV